MGKCPANYKNLNYIQSFSEQGYATIQLMQQACMNDEWLRQRVLKLNYLTPPAVRKWYKDMGKWIDTTKSYGHHVNGYDEVIFNNQIVQHLYVDFVDDDDKIDYDKTDAVIVTYYDDRTEIALRTNDEEEAVNYDSRGWVYGENLSTPTERVYEPPSILRACQLPYENEAEKKRYTTEKVKEVLAEYNYDTGTIDGGVNSAWYVGFDKSKNYYVRPDWINDWRDSEIPSMCRGQTFKAEASGKLESVDLILDYTGTLESDCGSPLYVQIWNTTEKSVVKTVWNNSKKTTEEVTDGNGNKVYEQVPFPDTTNTGIYKPLAQAEYNPSKMTAFGTVNIKFDKEVELVKGQSYFIALFSPLSEWKHCPRWGGWGRNCLRDQKYEYGHAFYSEDNGRTWSRFGRNDLSVEYKYGRYSPQDFAFKCHVRTQDKVEREDGTLVLPYQIDDASIDNPRYLYLKPILTNPITHIGLTADDDGGSELDYTNYGIGITYEYSTTGKKDDWHEIREQGGQLYKLENKSQVLLFRAKLYRNTDSALTTTVTDDDTDYTVQKYWNSTPKIYNLGLTLYTELPTEMYVRTHMWNPPKGDTMLGASLWGRLYAPFVLEPMVECTAEIITNVEVSTAFTIVNVDEILDYLVLYGFDEEVIDTVTGMNDIQICNYLYNKNPQLIEDLKAKNVYIKPYETLEGLCRLSFTPSDATDMVATVNNEGEYDDDILGGLQFQNNVAYPILSCELQPTGSTSDVSRYSEWIDFKFDYDNNILTFDREVLDSMPQGTLIVSYNEIFIDGLVNEEVGVHTNLETGLEEEGLILDYFKETFNITEAEVESRRVKLRVNPVDPIREVVLNRDTPNEKELFENFDYVLDVNTNEIVFNMTNSNGVYTSIFTVGDVLEVVYTPNLNASGLAVGYYATRTNKDKQVYIGRGDKGHVSGSYWEYKV